jgi:peptidoglycan/xylan/chitin deacetylase (PgdA/CDA1 family)
MDAVVAHFTNILTQFDCGATFPVTGAALARNPGVVEKYQKQNIELAVHGYHHVDHIRLPLDQQLAAFAKARRLFDERGVACHGFRSPYLRWSADTVAAVKEAGYLYDSSQVVAWETGHGEAHAEAYRRVLDFYGALAAADYPALPRWENGLVRIPYCLPDDEAIVDRLRFQTVEQMGEPWQAILAETYRLGELFTLGLHPERVALCEAALVRTLQKARQLSPGVWIARLDEIARWWIARAEATVSIAADGDELGVTIDGPSGVTILARGVDTVTPTAAWDGVYRLVHGTYLKLRADRRPFIGVSASSSPRLAGFLRQQGYIVEQADSSHHHTLYLDRPTFDHKDERPLLAEVERGAQPLVRLGRWPGGARSALCVTGDIDALTIWDYGLRFLGR